MMRGPWLIALLFSLLGSGASPALARAEAPAAVPSTPLSMPETLVEAPGPLEGRIVMIEMSRFPGEQWPEVERQVNQELQSLGLEVVQVSARARTLSERLSELRRNAADQRAVGAMRIVRQGPQRRVEIWLHDRLTGKTVSRQVEMEEETSDPNAASLVSLHAVEVLHSSLLEVQLNEKLRERIPPAVTRFIQRRERGQAAPRRWRAWVGPAAGLDLGERRLGAAPLLQIGVGFRLVPWLNLELQVDLPLLAASVEDHQGSADIRVTRVLGLLSLEPWARGRWSPSVALGCGLFALNAAGTAGGDRYQGSSEWASVAWLALRGGISARLTARLRLQAALSLGVATPGVQVRFAQELVATVGQPWLGGQLGLEWRWSSF